MTFNYPVDTVLLDSVTASNSATVTFSNITNLYNIAYVTFHSVYSTTNAVTLQCQLSVNNGAAWLGGYAGDYQRVQSNSAVLTSTDFAGVAQVDLAVNVSNLASNTIQGILTLNNPPVVGINNRFYWEINQDITSILINYSGTADIASSFNAIRFFMSAGNIAAGTFNVYGLVGPGAT